MDNTLKEDLIDLLNKRIRYDNNSRRHNVDIKPLYNGPKALVLVKGSNLNNYLLANVHRLDNGFSNGDGYAKIRNATDNRYSRIKASEGIRERVLNEFPDN